MKTRISNWKKACLSRFQVKDLLNNRFTGKGAILFVALWSLFFLSALAMAINAYVRAQLSVSFRVKNKAVVYYLAEAGAKKAIEEITANTLIYDTLTELLPSGEKKFDLEGFAGCSYSYELADEERKVNINKASFDVLRNFFETVALVAPAEAESLAAAVLDWREPGERPREFGAKSGYYQALNPPYPCKQGDFEVREELLLVKGMTPEIFGKIKDRVTVYGQGQVNINTADKLVLKSLGINDSLADVVINFRNGPDGQQATSDDNFFSSVGNIVESLRKAGEITPEQSSQLTDIVNAGLLGVGSDNFRGLATGKNPGDSISIDFVFDSNKKIKFWRAG
jgi:type II secretory pathway component PulK